MENKELVIPTVIKLGTLSVLDPHDNNYTMESTAAWLLLIINSEPHQTY